MKSGKQKRHFIKFVQQNLSCYANKRISKQTEAHHDDRPYFRPRHFGRAQEINLSQKQLAEKIQREDGETISPQYLNDIEQDRRAPTSDRLVAQFAEALDLKSDYLHYLNGRFPEKERQAKLTRSSSIKR